MFYQFVSILKRLIFHCLSSLLPLLDGFMLYPGFVILFYVSFLATQMSMKFIMLIIVKMPTIVGILTFISMINTTSESWKARNVFIFQHFGFYEQWKLHTHLS